MYPADPSQWCFKGGRSDGVYPTTRRGRRGLRHFFLQCGGSMIHVGMYLIVDGGEFVEMCVSCGSCCWKMVICVLR